MYYITTEATLPVTTTYLDCGKVGSRGRPYEATLDAPINRAQPHIVTWRKKHAVVESAIV
jgi:hypothetical protein